MRVVHGDDVGQHRRAHIVVVVGRDPHQLRALDQEGRVPDIVYAHLAFLERGEAERRAVLRHEPRAGLVHLRLGLRRSTKSCRIGGLSVVGGSPSTIGTVVPDFCCAIEPVVSGAACAGAGCGAAAVMILRCSACAFSTRSSTSAILPIWAFCAFWLTFDVLTLTFRVVRLSLSDFIAPRSCATLSFSDFTSSATLSLVTATCGAGGGLSSIPNLATPSEPPIAPMLAAIATQ